MDLDTVHGAPPSPPVIGDEDIEVVDEPQEVVHKLQRAVQYNASRQRLQQEAIAREQNNEAQHDEVIDAREQRSHIAIIQMAPPANQSSSSNNRSNVSISKNNTDNLSAASTNPVNTVPSKQGGSGIHRQENANSKKKRHHHCTVHGCTYNTSHKKDLARHMRKHTGEKPFNCDRCTKSFTRYDKLVLHIRTHEGYRPFACHICNHAATDSSSLKKHLRTHTDERPYKCQLCSYASKDSSQLVVHLRHHTGDSPYTCTFSDCDAAFKTPSDLSRHSRLHTGEKPYKCSYCDYRAAVKCNLNAHMRRHTSTAPKEGKRKTVVHIPPEEEITKDDKTDNNDLPGNVLPFQYACKLCDFKADSIDQFGVHMKEFHPGSSNLGERSKNTKTGKSNKTSKRPSHYMEQSFQCPSCKAAFVCEESLRCHLRQHAAIPNRPANVAPELYTPSRMRVVQASTENGGFNGGNVNVGGDYTLHEMQRVPFTHSVITENPAVTGNNLPITHHTQQHHQIHYDTSQSSADQQYLVSYNNSTGNITYRTNTNNNVEYHHP